MKDLPYFKFGVAEWINGDITLEDYYTQGVFTNICAFYWFRGGKLSLTEIKRRLSKAKPTAFDSLINSGIITVSNDIISISFLDKQLEERNNSSLINSENGSKGGRPRKTENKPTALFSLTETKGRREEENRTEEKREREEYGPTHENFVIVKGKYLNDKTARINGKDGLIAYMEANQTVLNQPEYAEKFMRAYKGKILNEIGHLQNSYIHYIEKQYK